MDDGWFGARVHDKAGLGDWFVNRNRFPEGLRPFVERVKATGVKFGIWVEPEMVNPDSDLYRAHPDWVISCRGRERSLSRSQMVLDMSNPAVIEYLKASFTETFAGVPIDYFKWDMNRHMSNVGSAAWPKDKQGEIFFRYMKGVYRLFDWFAARFPKAVIETCSGGGGRYDLGMMQQGIQIWTSDNTNPYDRTMIQASALIAYPAATMSCHVSECPNHQTGRVTPLQARADIAHLGATGYELDTTKMKTEEIAQINAQVEKYKKMEDLVLCGDLYRLASPFDTNLFAEEIVAKDKSRAHITTMRIISMPNRNTERVYPKGLDENATYTVAGTDVKAKGSTLMNAGLVCTYEKVDFATCTFELIRE
jgi:alpha-galactosidase